MKNLILCLFISLLYVSCFDDKGNYIYHDVNEVIVDIEETYGVRKQDTTVVIRPGIRQTLLEKYEHLRFEWYHNTFSDQFKGDLISSADTVAIVINTADPRFSYNHFLRFYVTDTLNDASYLFPVKLKVIKPYEGAWMVLHDQEGSARLGSIEYIGEKMEVTNDAFYKEQGRRLKGNAVALGTANYWSSYQAPRYEPTTLFFCFTDVAEESGIRMQDQNFHMYDSVPRFVYPEHLADFDVSNVSVCEGEGRGRIMVANGSLWQGSLYDSKLYKARIDESVLAQGENINITHATSVGWTFMAFDSEGNRFLHYYNENSSSSYTNFNEPEDNNFYAKFVREDENNIKTVDPSNINPNEKMIYLGSGYWYGQSMMASQGRVAAYGVTIDDKLGYVHVYEFHGRPLWGTANSEDFPFTFHTSFKTPTGITTETPMASSCAFNRLIFYGVGNKIFRLDFGAGGTSTLVFQHPDPNAKVSVMRFARKDPGANTPSSYEGIYADYEFPVMRSLGVGFNLPDGSGEVVILNLTSAGKVDKNKTYPAQQEHKGFGKIKDIVFI